MTIKLGVVMDPLASINPKKDSTLAMMEAARKKGWEVLVMEQADLYVTDGAVYAHMTPVEIHDSLEHWYTADTPVTAPLTDLDAVLMRKDPPFDMEYIYTTYLLEMAEKQGLLVLNRPGSIRDCNEKLFALSFPQCCPPHVVSRDPAVLKAFHQTHGDVIFKPLDGMGGASIFRIRPDDPNLSVIIETLTDHGTRQTMAQKYIPEIVKGDTRILMVNGEPVPYGLARIPAQGETRGNLAAGGSGVARPLNDRDLWICEQLGPELRARGLWFVGIDVIGDYLTEVNVTCPTCIREINKAYDLDIAGDYMNLIEQLLADGSH
ncbi:MAG: glutathione synthase [Pseudomonadales bacterium]|nr:glutathione synthase [Pseudomonadales bacterium]